MRNTSEFETLLHGEVNLDQGRIHTLVERVGTIEGFLQNSDWEPEIIRFSAQGSWAHKTIIKPPGNKGFDADLLAFIHPVAGWSARDYVFNLRHVFRASDRYREKTSLSNRCVTLQYSGDFDLDVVPCVVGRPGGNHHYEVCNHIDDEFEATDSEAYTAWLDQRNGGVGRDKLREVTRLLKYLRDIKLTFSCKSILLTTLLGERVSQSDVFLQDTHFQDISTALLTLVCRLDNYLQEHPDLHKITNPVLPSENFIRHWDDDKYANFRDVIHRYREWIEDAYHDPDEIQSVIKWQNVFGDEFGKGDNKTIAKIAETALLPIAATSQFQDAVQAIQVVGRQVLAQVKTTLPWMKRVPWQMQLHSTVIIRSTAHRDRTGDHPIGVVQSGEILPKSIELYFEAFTQTGLPYSSKDHEVQWQVVNTDRHAYQEAGIRGLRGGFYASEKDRRGVRWETTEYRGVHWIQAFVIRRRGHVCIGCSERFFVVIE